MAVTELVSPKFSWPGSGVDRSINQIHMSEIRDGALPDPKKAQREKQARAGGYQFDLDMCAEIGFMLEDALELCFKGRMLQVAQARPGEKLYQPSLYGVDRPGEIVWDGIAQSPDGVDWANQVLHEFKFRWASMPFQLSDDPSTKPGKDHQKIFFQVKSYLHALNELTDGEWDCILWILWSCGDRKMRPGPHLRVYHVKYSKEYLKNFWAAWVLPTLGDITKGVKK